MAQREASPGATDIPERRQRALWLGIRQGLIIMIRAIEVYLGIPRPRSER